MLPTTLVDAISLRRSNEHAITAHEFSDNCTLNENIITLYISEGKLNNMLIEKSFITDYNRSRFKFNKDIL